jgi:DNA-binding beta-propeller fold protein YncE
MCRERFFLYVIVLIGFTVFYSCSKRNYPAAVVAEPVFYPPPPDTARIQFLTRYGNSVDFAGSQKKFKTFVAGQTDALPILKPYGLALLFNRLYIADAGINGLQVVDLGINSFDYFIPAGRGKLILPINCFVDDGGDLYVSDVGRKQVVIFNERLEYKGEIGGDKNFKPVDVVVTGDTVFVTDPLNFRINAYNKSTLQLLFTFPEGASVGDKNWLYNPLNLCVGKGKIYVTDFGDSRVKMFTMNGEYISAVGSYGAGLAQFVRPKGIALDREENLYVVDAGFENVQIFNKEGQLLMFFGGPYKGPGDMYLPAKVIIDYSHLSYYEKFVDPAFRLKYLIFVTNQYGPDKVTVYGRIEPK